MNKLFVCILFLCFALKILKIKRCVQNGCIYFLGSSAEQTQSAQTQTADDGIFSKIKKALMG